MKIKLEKLILKNFKGVKELAINFAAITTILGENGTGKSTIFDAFMWTLFGKDSHGRSDFEIQTLDSDNNVIHGLEHSVRLVLNIDGTHKTLKRTLKERWVKPNGKADKEFKGCTTDFEVDEIPVKQKEYQAIINGIIDENLFKMVTSPLYFPNMNWQKQREILLDIIGDISEENVINYNSNLKQLLPLLTDGVDNFSKRVKASISKLKEEVKSIPARIDECNNNIKVIDATALKLRKEVILGYINSLDEQIADSSKASEEKLKLQEELFKLTDELSENRNKSYSESIKQLNDIQNKINETRNKVQDTTFNISNFESKKERICNYIEATKEELEKLKSEKQTLLSKYHSEYDKTFEFDIELVSCPHCGREYDVDKIQEIKADALFKFNKSKENILAKITSKGKKAAADIIEFTEKIKNNENDVESLRLKVIELETQKSNLYADLEELEKEKELLTHTEIIKFEGEEELQIKINAIRAEMDKFKLNDNSELKVKKKTFQDELEEINITLGKKDVNEDLKKRMEALNQEEKKMQIKIAELEGKLYLSEEFIRTKVELLEDSINKKFKGAVTFKLFENQINGGLSETCEALINGVPFSDANTASKMNAGLSILNTLCEHYGVHAPVFIDNAESINQIIHTDSQLIRLVVSLNEELKVEVAS
ncbi:AAA family ATPase [Clostridium chromiireducens]|uniref:Nuclease SbcCD subunit C n=1 Tax=Clostridium chromiireducens TaxID=225345 RepID=A0A964RNV2_9CLOT|nr:AAA family ATPase [Clostridium chromiireducens]MVX64985.1 AAA family ATPase [Clostridium chromiireducens]